MHVGWLATLRLAQGEERLDSDVLADRIAARLHLAPRFRQRVLRAPVGEPGWADDPTFRLERHIVVHKGAKVASERGLTRVAGEFLSEPLDRSRPLWSILVVPRAGAGHAAVLGKVHHAMVDGIAAVELGMLLFDLAPDAALPEPADSARRPRIPRSGSQWSRWPTAPLSNSGWHAGWPRWGWLRSGACGSARRCAAQRSPSQRTR